MANVKFSRVEFEKKIGKITDKLKEKITLFGTPLESLNNEEIEIEIFPNRPDLLSFQGYVRAFNSFLGKKRKTGLKEYKINSSGSRYKVIIDKSLKKIRPYTACAVVKGLNFNDERIKEIIDIQEKLHNIVGRKRKKVAIGIYPMEKIHWPITFTAREPDKIKFQPLESQTEMTGLKILQRHSAGREYSHLLAGKAKFPIFIDSKKQVLSMPPIINSHITGKINQDTKEVFIECSGFDFNILNKCLNIIITALAGMNGEIYSVKLDYKNKPLKNKKIFTPNLKPDKLKLNIKNAEKLLGIKLTEKQTQKLLEKMGYNYNKRNSMVSIPAWRTDILHEVDIIEDIAIAYGYNNLIPTLPEISATGQEDPKETIKRKISEILAGLNILEVSNYHITTKQEQFKKMNLNSKNKNIIEIIDSKTDYDILRQNLIHYLMKNLNENVDVEYPQKIFEQGIIFKGTKEKQNLAIATAPGNFTQIKQIFEYLIKMIDINNKIILESPNNKNIPNYFIDGRISEIKLSDKTIGYFGEIHPSVLKNWHIKMPVAALEISLEEIFDEIKKIS